MEKSNIISLQNFIEEKSQYLKLLKERFLDNTDYKQKAEQLQAGFKYLGLPMDAIKFFENRDNLVIWLGGQMTRYQGYELALYIGHKKMGLPVPAGLAEKCPPGIIALIEARKGRKYLQELTAELRTYSLSPDIFIKIHKAILNARLESILSDILSDLDRLNFKTCGDALSKIPDVYLIYLSQPSLQKLLKKISTMLRSEKDRMTEELRGIDLYSLRLKEQMASLYLETNSGLKEIMDNDVEKGTDILMITQKTSNLFSRLERLFLGNIYHLKDYETKRIEIQRSLKEEEDLKYITEKNAPDRRKPIGELVDEHLFFAKFGALTPPEDKWFSKVVVGELEELHRQKSKDLPLLGKFEKRALLGVELDFDAMKEAYLTFVKKELVPDYLAQCLLDLVTCFPPRENEAKKVMIDIANLVTLALNGREIMTLKKPDEDYSKGIVSFTEQFRRCITVLVYDIRGSSYMGIKLQNALREQKIKYKFAKEMAEVAKKYAGFLLKDTGDGGIVWFAENAESLYNHLYTESTTGKGMNLRYSIFSGAEFQLMPSIDAAKRAILCARDMVTKAEEFIRANFMHYREWFADVAERTMEVDGVTYALLPPEFKSLFRIGVGIASGVPERDVVIASNSFGDPDLVGPILADAHLYSMERQPGRSVMICDMPTFINFMLNIENFEFPLEESSFDKYLRLVEEIRKLHHGYISPDHKISVTPRAIHVLEELDKKKALVDLKAPNFQIDKYNNMYNEESRKIKPIYEVLAIQ